MIEHGQNFIHLLAIAETLLANKVPTCFSCNASMYRKHGMYAVWMQPRAAHSFTAIYVVGKANAVFVVLPSKLLFVNYISAAHLRCLLSDASMCVSPVHFARWPKGLWMFYRLRNGPVFICKMPFLSNFKHFKRLHKYLQTQDSIQSLLQANNDELLISTKDALHSKCIFLFTATNFMEITVHRCENPIEYSTFSALIDMI